MSDRQELEELRRLDELERKAAGSSAAPAPKSVLPKSNYGLTEDPGVIQQFLGGAKHAWDRAAAGLEDLVPGGKRLSEKLGQPDMQQLVKQGEQFVKETGPASTVGNIAGEIALTAAPGAGAFRLATAAPRVARMGRYGQAMVGGGAAGAAGETMMGGNPLEGAAYGAVLGPAGTAVGDLASGTVRGARRLFSGADDATTRYLRELSTDPNADAATLRALRGEVAGEMPTSGMAATVDPRMQYLAAIERQGAIRGTGGAPLARAQANEAARMAPLENIAAPGRETFNPLTRQMEPSYAQGERSRVTGPMYESAMGDRVAVQPTLAQVLRGAEVMPPAAKGGRQFAQEQSNAAAAGRGVPQGRTPYTEPPVVRDPSTGATMADSGPFMPQVETQSIRELQLVRKNLDDKIAQAVQQGDRMTARRLMEARNQLSGEMTGQSGNFNLANSTFRNMSQPQNAAEIAQVYANALRDQGVNGLVSARNNTARTLKRADQSSRFQHEGEVLTPQQLQDVNAVTRSAQRQADLNAIPDVKLPRQISAAEELEQGIPGLLNRPIAIAKKALQRLGSHTDEQVRAVIDEASLNPQRMADLLERIPASERQNFIDAVRAANPRGAITGTITGQIGQE
jgi:hypothetical protein